MSDAALRRIDPRRRAAAQRAVRARRKIGGFHPSQVATVVAGYYWEPAAATGSGTAGFSMPEASGKSSYNMVTPAANTAPTITTINGQPAVQFTNGSPDQLLRTSATVQRGFTGSVMIWGWVHAQTTNTGGILAHVRTATNVMLQLNSADTRITWTDDGGGKNARFSLPPGGYVAGPFYYEAVLKQGLDAEVWINRVQQTPSLVGTMGTTLQDTSEFLNYGGITGDSSTFNYLGDFAVGVMGITNGIPSDAERDRLFGYRRLK